MAQYGHNWYGTSYYGQTNAFSGWYQTKEIFTEEALKGTVTVNMRAVLPSATYGPNSSEIQKLSGAWNYDVALGKLSSNSTDAKLYMAATCDNIKLKYEQRTIGAKMSVKVTTTLPGATATVKTYILDTQSTTVNANAVYEIKDIPFGQHQLEITMASDSPAGAYFHFKGFVARTANLTIESRARENYDPYNPMPDSEYVKRTTTVTPISGDTYLVKAVTPSYAGKKYIQFKVYLASSDNETTPEVEYIEMIAGDTNNRTADGTWTAVFNMEQIAIQAGTSFSKVEEVTWTESVPATTSLTIRSKSATTHDPNNSASWDMEKWTVPYKQGVNRIRLKDGYQSGWIDTPFNAPASKRPYVVNKSWDSWEDQSFLPPDSGGTSIKYDFLNTQKDNVMSPFISITNPMRVAEKSLKGSRLKNFDNVIRITIRKTNGKQTPVVDYIKMKSLMHYEQDVSTENQEFSAVDFNNTGRGIVLNTSVSAFTSKFKIPAETSSPTYELIDDTRRPQDVVLYLDSERTAAIRTNRTNTLNNRVWAEAKVKASSGKTGLIKHYQYGGGQVKFPLKDEVQLAPTFTPSLKANMRYRYHLQMGWPDQYHTVVNGDVLKDIALAYGFTEAEIKAKNSKIKYNQDKTLMEGQQLLIPNTSVNNDVRLYWKSTNNERTNKSSHNAMVEGKTNMESDMVVAEVNEASTYGWVDWVSEEKIYDGVVNPNDIRGEYKRTHSTPGSGSSAEVEYVAVTGDTYKKIANIFGVYEQDVRRLNGVVVDDQQPVAGQRVMVPSRIVLPTIIPEAVVTDNPYVIDIVYNSVKKTDGKILSTNTMIVKPIQITYKRIERQGIEITRGQIANGKDLLNDPRVVKIDSIYSLDGNIRYNEYDSTLKIGNFKRDGNYVDWSPTEREPARGEKYIVNYWAEVPDKVTITIDTSYEEEGGVDRIWRSPEVKEFKGMCYPGKDHVMELPGFNSWIGMPDPNVEDIEYIVEDNDIWVKTWVEKRNGVWCIIGSLQDRVPKDNWFPTIKTGYYYLGKDEYYMFNEPIIIEPTERQIPVAKNVDFVEGKFQNAARVQEGSTNLVRNSGFDTMTTNKTVFKLTF